MKNCWASNYSECSGKISREHYISQGVFEQQFIYVKGFKWCKGKERKISIANLTSKVLCEHHNNELSEVDQTGINAIRIFEELIPEKYRSNKNPPTCRVIDGINFERWLLKVAINLSYRGEMHIGVGMTDSEPGLPSPYLLQVVFGRMRFSHKMGLYTLCYETSEKFEVGKISMTSIHKDQAIGGFIFHIRGLDFFLSLYPGHAPPRLETLGLGSENGIRKHIYSALPIYRKKEVISINEQGECRKVPFKWH